MEARFGVDLVLMQTFLPYYVNQVFLMLTSCCGATVGSEQQHNQDLREIYKGRRILEFITFYHNALYLTRAHCATNKSNKNTGKFASLAAKTQIFLCSKFSTARLEVLPNLRHAGVFQMSTMVNLGMGSQFKSLCLVQVLNLTRR